MRVICTRIIYIRFIIMILAIMICCYRDTRVIDEFLSETQNNVFVLKKSLWEQEREKGMYIATAKAMHLN